MEIEMKKNRIMLFCVIGLVIGMLIGCGTGVYANSFYFRENDSQGMWRIGMPNKLADYVDEQTGVHYLLVYDEDSLNSLCPRYNADGTLMVEEKK